MPARLRPGSRLFFALLCGGGIAALALSLASPDTSPETGRPDRLDSVAPAVDCPPCDDGEVCTVDFCDPAVGCRNEAVVCDDQNPCTQDACVAGTGCQFTPLADDTPCADSTLCTTAEACQAGQCVGSAVNCDDGSFCTVDQCNPGTGACQYFAAVSCNDNNVCTVDACDPATGQCSNTPLAVGAACDDGSPCTSGEVCVLAPGQAAPRCVGTPAPVGTACDDGNVCTQNDRCLLGGPTGMFCAGTSLNCSDGDACTSDGCVVPTGCVHQPFTCNDGNPCTTDSCNPATGCQFTPLAGGTTCSDNNVCTVDDACGSGPNGFRCYGTPTLGASCADTNACTVGDQCVSDGGAGAYCQGTSITCDDGNVCTSESCNSATGQCVIGPLVCNDGNPCTQDACAAGSGCQYTPLANGTTCSDNNLCTQGEACQTGSCVGGSPVTCNDGNPCTLDSCNAANGQCRYQPNQCADGSACTLDSCDPATGVCQHVTAADGTLCTDNNACTQGDACQAGACAAGSTVTCDDGNACTQNFCSPSSGCTFPSLPNGTACNDGNACTQTDACQSGQCAGSSPVVCNDSNPCTADSCDPPSGGCLFAPLPLPEVTPLTFADQTTFSWPATPAATHWNSYRGTIPAGMLGSRLPGTVYDHTCYESADANLDGPTTSIDSGGPPPGSGYYYEATHEGACGEGPLGSDWTGAARPNPSPCPTPP